MPLQTEVAGPVITSAGEKYHNKVVNAEFILKCWPEGMDVKTTEPVINRKFAYQQKTEVEGKTTNELVIRIEIIAGKDMQKVINEYNFCKDIESKLRVNQMASNIQGALNG